MHRLPVTFAIAAAVLLLCGDRSFACEGDKVLLAENFSAADASWGEPNGNFAIKDGAAVLKADGQHGYKALDNAFLFDDSGICVTATALEIGKPEESAGGLDGWAALHFLTGTYGAVITAPVSASGAAISPSLRR